MRYRGIEMGRWRDGEKDLCATRLDDWHETMNRLHNEIPEFNKSEGLLHF